MPVNEILAPFYVIVRYITSAYPTGHTFRMYFEDIPAIEEDNVATFDTYTDAGHPGGWTLKEVVNEVISRYATQVGIAQVDVLNVEMWESAVGDNIFKGLDGGDYSAVSAGDADGVASAYGTFVLSTLTREHYRLTLFETNDAKPQRTAGTPPPSVDDGTVQWFFTKSAVKFTTNDGLRLTTFTSFNRGYNRKLAKSYGRNIIP